MALLVKKLELSEYGVKMKATIQQNGKLSFTEVTAEHLNLVDGMRFAIYQDQQKPKEILYMVVANEDEQAFPVKKSGMYYYLGTKTLFDRLGIDYSQNSYAYDILRTEHYDAELGGVSYQLKRRLTSKKNPPTQEFSPTE